MADLSGLTPTQKIARGEQNEQAREDWVNDTSGTVTTPAGTTLKPLKVIQDEIEAAAATAASTLRSELVALYEPIVYATTAALTAALSGLDVGQAVIDDEAGEFGFVVDDSGNTFLPIIEVAGIASSIASAAAKTTAVELDLFGLVDSADSNALKKITYANLRQTIQNDFGGIFQAANSTLRTLQGISGDDVYKVAVDANGYVGRIDLDGGSYPTAPVKRAAPTSGKQMLGIPMIGQSLGQGYDSRPVITTTEVDDCFMFNGGVNTADTSEDPAVSMTSLIGYKEQEQGSNNGETPCSGMAYMLRQIYRDEYGSSLSGGGLSLLLSSAARSGQPLSNLDKPSTFYTRIINQVTQGKALAEAAGYDYDVKFAPFMQGVNDYNLAQAIYLSTIQNFQSDVETDVQAITGKSSPVPFIMTQTWFNLWSDDGLIESAIAQLTAHETDPDKFILAAPHYFMNTIDGTHLPAFVSSIMGAYIILAAERKVLSGGSWEPTRPLSFSNISGNQFDCRFAIQGRKLVLDTRAVREARNFGFAAYNPLGEDLTITGVALADFDTLRFTLSETVPAGARLRYADESTQEATSGGYPGVKRPLLGARGNLRDSAGDFLKYTHPSGYTHPMHNWCIAFDKEITA